MPGIGSSSKTDKDMVEMSKMNGNGLDPMFKSGDTPGKDQKVHPDSLYNSGLPDDIDAADNSDRALLGVKPQDDEKPRRNWKQMLACRRSEG